MSSALTYIVLGFANNLIGPQPPPNISPITYGSIPITIQGPFQFQARHNNYTYTPGIGAHRVHSGVATWNTGRRICEEDGGHLAIMNSVAEAEAVARLLVKASTEYGYVGVHDLYQEDEFVTIHGQSLAQTGFDAWRQGEPNNEGGDEDCVLLSALGKLVDVPCTIRHNFVCELSYISSHVLQVSPHLGPTPASVVVNPGIA